MDSRGSKRPGAKFPQQGQKRCKVDLDIGNKPGRPCAANAERERSRVKTLRTAFLELQRTLPSVPADTKLSKLDVLVLATTYIAYLMKTLNEGVTAEDGQNTRVAQNCLHPMKKWPMRSRLYQGITSPDVILQDKAPEVVDDRFKLTNFGQEIDFDANL